MMKKITIMSALVLAGICANAQLKVGGNPTVINANSVLEIESTNKGLLLPRVALTGTVNAAPLAAHVAGMAVYNTATASDVTPGYYFNTGTKWVRPATPGQYPITIYGSGAPTGACSEDNLYIDTLFASPTFGNQYRCNNAAWVTYTSPAQTPFYLFGSVTNDAGANKLPAISRFGTVQVLHPDLLKSTQISIDGAIELFRSPALSTGNTNGYIDFKADKTHDYDFRLNWDNTLGTTGGFGFNSFKLNTYPNYLMTLLNTGNVGIGTSTPITLLEVAGTTSSRGYSTRSGVSGTYAGNVFNISWNGTGAALWIDNTNLGFISTTSDRRLKDNIKPISLLGLDLVKRLKPVSFRRKNIANTIFTGNEAEELGFIADELQEVIPSAVNGEKNAVTKDGKLQPQSLSWAPIVSVLTKAIQEQQMQIASQAKDILELKAALSQITIAAGNSKK